MNANRQSIPELRQLSTPHFQQPPDPSAADKPLTLKASLSRAAASMLVALLLVITVSAGCNPTKKKRSKAENAAAIASKERREAIGEAFRYLPQLIRMDRTAALQEIRYQLNTWSKSVTEPPEWKQADMLESVQGTLRTMDFAQRMTKLEFGEPECEFLLQSQIFKDIGRWVLQLPYRDRVYAEWLDAQKKSMSDADWLQLETTLKIFDWAMCNVAVDGNPKDVERLINNPDGPTDDGGPVYRQLPWQTVMFARGDTWQRARAFTQLIFAQGVDSVVLALPSVTGATENASLRLWCVAVPIGNELYLFEPQWGLPIPSQSGNGIATLREAKADPNVLRRARLPGRFDVYPVEQKDLNKLVALVDVEPFAVGRTMYTLERSLTGDNRQRISFDGDAFEKKVNAIDPALSLRLWNVPWLAHVYNLTVRDRLFDMSPFSMAYMEQYGIFITDSPISRARMLHFKGQFESTIEATGALRTYMDFRVDEQTLKQLAYDRATQMELGVVKRPTETVENFELRVKQAQNFYRRSKFDIGIFLAMANVDLGKNETAADWLTKRTLAVKGTERWHAHAHYLLGRTHEQLNDLKSAIEEFKFEESPQAAGNRIRIRRLEQMLNPASTPEVNK